MSAAEELHRRGVRIEELRARVVELEKAALDLFPYSERLTALRAQNAELVAALEAIKDDPDASLNIVLYAQTALKAAGA